ncbi:hypothetical protein CHS0354_000176 [Potamilus streckersoni]|uniref:Uncharacterized protein n=1 Tax=Potamilus streckersoni TaxID=2493646 RepID=A0AAE0RM29_9BIVA|nr:hypothetical protein CHS0354_000176 [Potamilus streckersoni]
MELTAEKDSVQGAQDGILPCTQTSIVLEDDKQENKNELERASLVRQSVTLREGLRRTFSAPTKLSSHMRIGRSRKKHSDKNSLAKPQEDSGQTSIKMDYLKVPMKLKKQREVGRTPKTFFAAIYNPQDKSHKHAPKQSLRKRHHVLLIVIFAIIVIVIIIVSVLKVKKHPDQQHLTG